MKLIFSYNGETTEVSFDKMVLFNASYDNQDVLTDILDSGLNGQLKDFLLENPLVKKNSNNLILFDNNNVNDDLKFNSKSILMKSLNSIDEQVLDVTTDLINEKLSKLNDNLNNTFKYLKEFNYEINPHFEIMKSASLFKETFILTDDDLNPLKQIELEMLVVINYFKLNVDKKFHFIINHFNLMMDTSQQIFIINQLTKLDNVYVYLLSNNFDLYESSDENIANYFVYDDKISKYIEVEKDFDLNETIFELLDEKEKKDVLKTLNFQQRKKEYEKYFFENNVFK